MPSSPPSDLDRVLSMDALRWAWMRVRENRGAAGGDGITIGRFERMRDAHLLALADDVRAGTYRPGPVRSVLIRGPRKTRRIALICLRDRVLQRAVLDRLGPHCESRFLPSSFGYRTGLSLHDAVDRIVRLRNRGLTIVIDADIRNCFDTLDHTIMRAALFSMIPHLDPGLASLIDLWIAMPPQQRSRRQAGLAPAKRTRGVLQGAPISPLLCNIYLHQLDDALARRRLSLTRYADDFVVLCPTIDHAMTGLIAIQQVLGDIGLECHPRKTRITTFDEGFAFLGVEFKGTDYTYEVEGKRIRIDTFPPGWFHYLAEGYDG